MLCAGHESRAEETVAHLAPDRFFIPILTDINTTWTGVDAAQHWIETHRNFSPAAKDANSATDKAMASCKRVKQQMRGARMLNKAQRTRRVLPRICTRKQAPC